MEELLAWLFGGAAPSSGKTTIAYRRTDPDSMGFPFQLVESQKESLNTRGAQLQRVMASPMAQDTVASILAALVPDKAIQTVRTNADGVALGEYYPKTGEVSISLSRGQSDSQYRETFLHEVGHAVGHEAPSLGGRRARSEPFADVFLGLINTLGQTGAADSPADIARKAVDQANYYRAGRTTGINTYDAPLDNEWVARAETLAKMVLGSDIYRSHPANKK